MESKKIYEKDYNYLINKYLSAITPIRTLESTNEIYSFEVVYNGKHYIYSKDIYGTTKLIPMNDVDDMLSMTVGKYGMKMNRIAILEDIIEYNEYLIFVEKDNAVLTKYEYSSNNEKINLKYKNDVFNRDFLEETFPKKIRSIVLHEDGINYGISYEDDISINETFNFWRHIKDYKLDYDLNDTLYEINNKLIEKYKIKTR